jgi:hypothetical protein
MISLFSRIYLRLPREIYNFQNAKPVTEWEQMIFNSDFLIHLIELLIVIIILGLWLYGTGKGVKLKKDD